MTRVRKRARLALSPFLGRVRYQPIFQGLLELSLRGMNHGGGQDVRRSGEGFVLAYVARLAARQPSPAVVLDVGAHHGDFARAAAAAFGDRSRIWALEPSPTAFAELDRRMDEYRKNPGEVTNWEAIKARILGSGADAAA